MNYGVPSVLRLAFYLLVDPLYLEASEGELARIVDCFEEAEDVSIIRDGEIGIGGATRLQYACDRPGSALIAA